MADKECTKCIHHPVCKTAESCDGYVSGCEHFKEQKKGRWLECDGTVCSKCNKHFFTDGPWAVANYRADYCPNCGRRLPQPPKGE